MGTIRIFGLEIKYFFSIRRAQSPKDIVIVMANPEPLKSVWVNPLNGGNQYIDTRYNPSEPRKEWKLK